MKKFCNWYPELHPHFFKNSSPYFLAIYVQLQWPHGSVSPCWYHLHLPLLIILSALFCFLLKKCNESESIQGFGSSPDVRTGEGSTQWPSINFWTFKALQGFPLQSSCSNKFKSTNKAVGWGFCYLSADMRLWETVCGVSKNSCIIG